MRGQPPLPFPMRSRRRRARCSWCKGHGTTPILVDDKARRGQLRWSTTQCTNCAGTGWRDGAV